MSFKPELKDRPRQLISEEEIYYKGRDNSNFMIGLVFGGVAVFCAGVLYVVTLLDSISY